MTSPLHNEARRWQDLKQRLLASMPELANDPECLVDSLDGLTDLKEQLTGLLRSALLDEANAEAIDNYIKQLSDRKAHKTKQAKKKKAVALNFMADTGLQKIEAPDMTAFIRNVPPSVTIFHEGSLPEEYVRVKREPDKKAIGQALKEGKDVPGAQLGNASQSLTIKV